MAQAIPLIMTAAAAGIQYAGGQQTKSAENNAAVNELNQQAKFQKQASAVANQSINDSSHQASRNAIQAGTQNTENQYENTQAMPLSSSVPPTPQNKVVNAVQQARTDQSNHARSAIQGYNAWLVNQGINQARAGQQLGMIGNFASSTERNVFPYQMMQASHAGDATQAVGSLLGTAGSVYGTYQGLNQPGVGGYNTTKSNFADPKFSPVYGGGYSPYNPPSLAGSYFSDPSYNAYHQFTTD